MIRASCELSWRVKATMKKKKGRGERGADAPTAQHPVEMYTRQQAEKQEKLRCVGAHSSMQHVVAHVSHAHLPQGCVCFSLRYSSAPEWLEPVLWPRTWLCELIWKQQQQQQQTTYLTLALAWKVDLLCGLPQETFEKLTASGSTKYALRVPFATLIGVHKTCCTPYPNYSVFFYVHALIHPLLTIFGLGFVGLRLLAGLGPGTRYIGSLQQ